MGNNHEIIDDGSQQYQEITPTIPVGGIDGAGQYVEVTHPINPDDTIGMFPLVSFYFGLRELRIPLGLAHHKIVLTVDHSTSAHETEYIHYCKQLDNVISEGEMWQYDELGLTEVSDNLIPNSYYHVFYPKKDPFDMNPNNDGLISYWFLHKRYDEDNNAYVEWDNTEYSLYADESCYNAINNGDQDIIYSSYDINFCELKHIREWRNQTTNMMVGYDTLKKIYAKTPKKYIPHDYYDIVPEEYKQFVKSN